MGKQFMEFAMYSAHISLSSLGASGDIKKITGQTEPAEHKSGH